jgi:hypothetical protein
MDPHRPLIGHDRCLDLSRRQFARAIGTAALGVAAAPLAGAASLLRDEPTVGPTPKDASETAVARFYASLSDDQKKLICFPFDDKKRSMVNNNWAIVKPRIDDLNSEQQSLCQEIMKGLCSDDGYDRFMRQMEADYGGFEQYHVAVFGEPGTGQPFEWVLSGRHDTLRADGNSVDGLAFGGPIFYGHDATGSGNDDAQHSVNVWWYQGEQANRIFKSLDEKQRAQSLVDMREPDAPRTIRLKGELDDTMPGLAVATLDSQQKAMVKKLLEDMLMPFRKVDADEVRQCLVEAGGVDKMRLTYFKDGDIGGDGVWDIWKLEGPAFNWYFHGSPHVHTWLHVARRASDQRSAEG